jgi:hypothetical protein
LIEAIQTFDPSGVDGSVQSFKSAEYPIDIAKENNAQLIALSVLAISLYYLSYNL